MLNNKEQLTTTDYRLLLSWFHGKDAVSAEAALPILLQCVAERQLPTAIVLALIEMRLLVCAATEVHGLVISYAQLAGVVTPGSMSVDSVYLKFLTGLKRGGSISPEINEYIDTSLRGGEKGGGIEGAVVLLLVAAKNIPTERQIVIDRLHKVKADTIDPNIRQFYSRMISTIRVTSN